MTRIQCSYDYFKTFIYCYYLCRIDNQIIPSSDFNLDGKHEALHSNNDVQKLFIADCTFTEFPKVLQEIFPNITFIHIKNCKLDKIGREHIGKWTKLTEITISDCGIKKLKGDTFRGLTQLESIDLRHNFLEEIDPDTFDGFKLLKSINLYGNKSINAYVEASIPARMVWLKNEIITKCKPKTTDEMPSSFTNKIKELEQENEKLASEIVKRDKKIKEIQAKSDQFEKALENSDQLKKENTRLRKLEAIMTDPAFKDFTINIDDSLFKVHKLLFAGRSETLAELFRNNPEATELNLRDIPEATFKAVHDFIYTNQLPEDDVNYLEVFAAANRLKIDDLVEITANQLLNKIDENNSIEILELSNKFNHQQLREKAYDIIRTKIFPDRKISDNLAKNTEKLKKLIEMKKMFEEEFETE